MGCSSPQFFHVVANKPGASRKHLQLPSFPTALSAEEHRKGQSFNDQPLFVSRKLRRQVLLTVLVAAENVNCRSDRTGSGVGTPSCAHCAVGRSMAENSCETSFQTYQGVCRIRVEVTIKIKRGYGVREGRMCKWGAIGKSSQQADVCGQAVVATSASSLR